MKNKKGEFPFLALIIPVIVGVVMLSLIWAMQTGATEYDQHTDSWTATTIPVNVSLSQDIPIALVSVTNSFNSVALGAGNYTDHVSDGYVTMLDNSTNADITYTYQQTGYITSSISRTVISFLAICLAVGLIIFLVGRRKD